jgi:hypothetical protein
MELAPILANLVLLQLATTHHHAINQMELVIQTDNAFMFQ